MAADLSAIRPYVQPHVIGCPVPLVDQAIVRSVIEFCARTGVWRYEQATQAVVKATTKYGFAPPAGAKVERVLAAWLDGKPLKVLNATDMLGAQGWLTETGAPYALVALNDSQYRVYPLGDGDVDMIVTLKPARTATTIEDDIFEAHVDAIADGALARLMAQPGKSWSNSELGLWHKGQYEGAIDDATHREFRHAPMRTVPPKLR